MPSKGKVKVGIIGSRFQGDIHAASFHLMPEEAEVVAVASPTPGSAAKLAERYQIPRVFTDYREMLKEDDIEMVTITAPNRLHAQMTVDQFSQCDLAYAPPFGPTWDPMLTAANQLIKKL